MAAKRGKSSGDGENGFDPEKKYNEFPSGESIGFGRDAGYGELVQINDRKWFTEEAQRDPVINAFLEAFEYEQVAFSYLQLKSSTSESEWFIHEPHIALSKSRKSGIAGTRARVRSRPAHRHLRHQPSPHAGPPPGPRHGGQRRQRGRPDHITRETAPRAGIRSCAVRRAITRTLRSHATAPPAAPT